MLSWDEFSPWVHLVNGGRMSPGVHLVQIEQAALEEKIQTLMLQTKDNSWLRHSVKKRIGIARDILAADPTATDLALDQLEIAGLGGTN